MSSSIHSCTAVKMIPATSQFHLHSNCAACHSLHFCKWPASKSSLLKLYCVIESKFKSSVAETAKFLHLSSVGKLWLFK